MQTVLIVIHLMIVLALVGVVLIQRSEGGGLGIGGGSGFMSARGAANALTRTTAILATLFFLTSIGLGIIARYEAKPTDILEKLPDTLGTLNSKQPDPAKETPADPNAIPTSGDNVDAVKPADAKPVSTETVPAATDAKPTDAKPADVKPADATTKTEPAPAQ